MAEREDSRMAWSGVCDECGTGHIVFPTDEQAPDVQQQVSETWPETFSDCMVADCDGTVEWNGNDPIASILHSRML